MGSFVKSGGKPIRTFTVWNEAGQKYKATELENIISSSEVRRDGMSNKGRVETYCIIEDGRPLVPVEGETDTYKIGNTDEVVWKL